MRADHVFSQAVDAVAEGRPVDWDLLDSQASDAEEREQLKWLRILGDLAGLHRSGDDDPLSGDPPEGEPLAEGEAPQGKASERKGLSGRPLDDVMSDDAEEPPLRSALARLARAGDDAAPGVEEPSSTTTAAAAGAGAYALRRWGRFHLLEQVGEGSFGRVYRAWDPQLEREVAIKILHSQYSADRLRERLLREGRALAKVRHANVVNVHAVEAHEGRVGLCMEFVRGHTLDDVLVSEGKFPVDDAVRITRDVCHALAAVHHAGFVHRDVKARNVMRDETRRIVLMDFGTGLDVRLPEAERARDKAGTPLYMAPEVLAGGEESPGSDVYSLGVLLFHLLTQEYPVQGKDIDGLRAAHAEGRAVSLRTRRADVPMRLARIVDRMLAPRPEDRYAHAHALLAALDQAHPAAAPSTRWRRLLITVPLVVVGVLATALALGILMSAAFNNSLGRGGFAQESVGDWLVWGLRASVAPAFVFAVAWLLSACTIGASHLLLRLSGRAAALDASLRARARRWARRAALDEASVVASWLLLLSAAALVGLWWRFSPLIWALSSGISDGAPELLALLSPAFLAEQDLYRQSFMVLVFASGVSWYAVARMAAQQQRPLRPGLLAAALVMLGLALVSRDLPYRLLIHSKFDMARWNGQTCYVLGRRGPETLLTCAGLETPRNRVVPTAETEPLGRRENVYTPFASARAK